ncbi:MAG TPA: VWA domain-containing protein [Candidatus Dormibacteraeota bacterium]|nr:VWA domain-containing protein [Candidatus Dormibacteraeota bacterium]
MEEHIHRFAVALRQAGIRISPPEVADALIAAGAVDIEDRPSFRSALRATLVKRDFDLDTFEQLFELYFSPYGSRQTDLPPRPEEPRALPPLPDGALDELGPELARLWAALRTTDDLELALLIRETARREGAGSIDTVLQQGMAGRLILQGMGLGLGSDAALDRFAQRLRESGMSEEDAQAWRDAVRRQLDRLRAAVRGFVRAEYDRNDGALSESRRARELSMRSIEAFTPRETAEMSRLVERLGRKLDSLPELRRAPRRKGSLDMHRTWRSNLQTGGVPFRLRWEDPPQRKPQVVALCDISNSVQSTVRLMLHFLYRLQDRFSRVRSFVFVSDCTEVSDEFLHYDAETAIAHALQPKAIAYYSATNYGRSLERFLAQYDDSITSRSVVLVLGDARGNYTNPRADLLGTIKGRARRVLWFNPEGRLSWGLGDSSMNAYLPHCTQAFEVRTLAHLESAIETLVGAARH